MHAFIIRPFGVKKGIDFDAIDRTLIAPALENAGVVASTTASILEPGNIREDMFQLLLTSDVVVADITIHNANVYYELGIRHALRTRITVLLRGRANEDDELQPDGVPFDLLTDRYLEYRLVDPASSSAKLSATVRRAASGGKSDSPVYKLLPALNPPPHEQFLAAPADFTEELKQRVQQGEPGDLALLAHEVRGLPWQVAGLRLVGRAQFAVKHYPAAARTWETLLLIEADDPEANRRLATIYQKMSEYVRSEQAAARALQCPALTARERAEAYALIGSNYKTRWIRAWEEAAPTDREVVALQSPFLRAAAKYYESGFLADLNHYYPGINALGLLVIRQELAGRHPHVWRDLHDDDVSAEAAGLEDSRRIAHLTGALELSLRSVDHDTEETDIDSLWRQFTQADLALYMGERAPRTAQRYREAAALAAQHNFGFAIPSARRQLGVFRALGVRSEHVDAALRTFQEAVEIEAGESSAGETAAPRVLVFTGHRVDTRGRETPRFPNTPEFEQRARHAIRRAIEAELPSGVGRGVAQAASGGDILFHEECARLGVETSVFLPFPPGEYAARSVRDAGYGWHRRFQTLVEERPVRWLGTSARLPDWLSEKEGYDVWQRSNLWLLNSATAAGTDRVTVIAIWDGESAGDGPGGTAHLVAEARAVGARVVHINTRDLLGIGV